MNEHTKYVEELNASKCDPKLGAAVREHLEKKGLVPPASNDIMHGCFYQPGRAVNSLQRGISDAFRFLGIDLDNDDSMRDTPRRYAHMLVGELTKGLNFDFFPKCTATPNGVKTGDLLLSNPPQDKVIGAYNQMVLVDNIETMSLCEHHLQTIDGFTHIAYIPGPRVLGLSKFARVTEFFARRPQIQERMTEQIYEALSFVLETEDIAVVQRATHFCMRARGARQHSTQTATNKMGGKFMSNTALREEFLNAIPS